MKTLFLASITLVQALAADYFPLEVGNYWNYRFLDRTGNVIGTDSLAVSGTKTIGTQNVFLLTELHIEGPSVDTITNYALSRGNDIHLGKDSLFPLLWEKYYQHSFQGGEAWRNGNQNWTVAFAGRVTGPAGSFDSCFFVYSDSLLRDYFVLAPDVGVIQGVENGFVEAELVDYHRPSTAIRNRMLPLAGKNRTAQLAPGVLYRPGSGLYSVDGKRKAGAERNALRIGSFW